MSENKHETAQQRIDDLSTNSKKQKLITRIVVVLLILIFLGGMVWGIFRILGTEEIQEPQPVYTDKTEVRTDDPMSILGYYAQCTLNMNEYKKSRADITTKFWIDDETIKLESNNQMLLSTVEYMKGQWLDSIAGELQNYSTEFGEDFSSCVFPVNYLTSDVKSIDITTGRKNDAGEIEDEGYRFVTIVFPEYKFDEIPLRVIVGAGIDGYNNALYKMDTGFAGFLKVLEPEAVAKEIKIEAKIDRETDFVDSITYTRVYSVKSGAMFEGEVAKLGRQDIELILNAETKIVFTRASITLNSHELWLKKGGTESLQADRPKAMADAVKWTSSAPEIVSVDDEGYIKSHAVSNKPVTITASVEFLGNTYTDTCEVWSVVPVTKVKLEEKTATVKVGQTVALHAAVQPEKATIKQVVWGSDDESIATVDENGVVTALKPGTVTIYVLARDGWFKQSCTVTVTK